MYERENHTVFRQLSNKERIMTNKKKLSRLFMILLALALWFLFEGCASLGKDTQATAKEITPLPTPEMLMLSEQNKSDSLIPQINDLGFAGKLNEQWAEEQKKLKDDLLNYKLYSDNQFNYWKMQEELKEYYKNHPQFFQQMHEPTIPDFKFNPEDFYFLQSK
jgi:hypothetical protein